MVEDSSMQAVILEAPEINLQVEEVPVQAGKVLLNVTACSVCRTDQHMTKEETPSRRRLFWATRSQDRP